jgi:hypothetical protein
MTAGICKGQTKDGRSCGAKPRPGTDLCPWHDPNFAERRAEWSRKGGVNSSTQQRARRQLPGQEMTATELHAFLAVVLKGVVVGRIDARIGNAAANIARSMNEIGKSADLEQRMAELERRLGSKAS